LIALAVVAGLVLFVPATKPEPFGVAALMLTLVVLVLVLGRGKWPWPRSRWLWVVAVAVAAVVPLSVIARGFGRLDLMAILFHVEFGTAGATLAGLENEILTACLAGLLFFLAVVGLAGHVGSPRVPLAFGVAVLVLANPLIQFFAINAVLQKPDLNLASRLEVPVVNPPAVLPDIVVVYLEGLERDFARSDLFGDAYAPVAALEPEALTLTGVGQSEGTGWSMAGIVASQCGVPLLPHGFLYRNNYTIQRDFMVGQTCRADDLAREAGCTLRLAAEFVADISARSVIRDRQLAIVLLSDHLNHSSMMARRLPYGARRNTVLMIGGPRAGEVIARDASMMDVYPTVLAWLGFVAPDAGAGLGRSLLGDRPTLTEDIPQDVMDRTLIGDPALSAAVWR
jgi:hypothetical protein